MKRALGRATGRLAKAVRTHYGGLLREITEMIGQLPPDGANRLLRWSGDRRLPDELRWLVVHPPAVGRSAGTMEADDSSPAQISRTCEHRLIGKKVRTSQTRIQGHQGTEDRLRSGQLHGGGL